MAFSVSSKRHGQSGVNYIAQVSKRRQMFFEPRSPRPKVRLSTTRPPRPTYISDQLQRTKGSKTKDDKYQLSKAKKLLSYVDKEVLFCCSFQRNIHHTYLNMILSTSLNIARQNRLFLLMAKQINPRMCR